MPVFNARHIHTLTISKWPFKDMSSCQAHGMSVRNIDAERLNQRSSVMIRCHVKWDPVLLYVFGRKEGKDSKPANSQGRSLYPPINTLPKTYHRFKEEDKNIPCDRIELVLDGGFMVPDTNSFGHTFRDYDAECERKKSVEEFYWINHINQSYEFVKRMREEYGKLTRVEMSIWECCELLNEFVDESDPDLDEPQIEHLLQTAEAIRKDYPDEDWLHLTGLIHDLGKVLLHRSFGELPQWAVVGDTFPVGCAFNESIVHHKYFKENPDYNNPAYNTKYGVYSEGCGLNNVMMSWGHDDYMYLVATENKSTLPSAALFIIRYHSFYPLHRSGAYKHLMNEEDVENLKWLQIFNKYDLYSKSKVRIDVEKVKPYYLSLIEKKNGVAVLPCKAKMVKLRALKLDGSIEAS
ncbi:hypothetical protein HHK36_014210 [Tetracentron sinense]|uniref:inositol oxygenase n=1 Tax=Tetracentron sinense TaxID=13715 RepID=A0A835DHH8_TETSI|nr:hypothetical protein HHK36_014210 [Tetracentron sinense]